MHEVNDGVNSSGQGSALDRICLNRCAPPPSGNAPGQNPVNAAAIEIDDLETPALMIKAFADGRKVTELIENSKPAAVPWARSGSTAKQSDELRADRPGKRFRVN
jgi:hypothetical protein